MFAGVHIRDVGMEYHGRPLFSDVSVTIAPGQRIIATGTNGSGKTTFLKIVAGLLRPSHGTIAIAGRNGEEWDDVADRRRFATYAGPDVNAYDELTARENLAFHARLRGVPISSCEALLERVGIARSKRDHPVKTYSSGMRQRIRLAVSLVGNRPLLIWDEPTAMLDESGRSVVEDCIARHVHAGGTALIATNDSGEIGRWGDRRIHFGA